MSLLAVRSFLFFMLLVQEADGVNLINQEGGRSVLENQMSVISNTNSSLHHTTNAPITDDSAGDPCQNLTTSGDHHHHQRRSSSNVFAEVDVDQWEYRYLECETDDTPCTAESSCCECKLVCIEGFESNCTAIPTNPPTSIVDTSSNNPGMVDGEVGIPATSFTSSSGLDWIAAFASLIILLSCSINTIVILRKLRKRGLDHSRYPIVIDTDDALTLPPADGGKDPVYVAKVKRHEDIICKFHFRTIPYKPLDGGSSRSFASGVTNDSGTENNSIGELECPVSPASVQRRLQKQKRRRSSKLSFWRRPVRQDECCICLENYGQGDTICVPLSSSCSHMFHEECVVAWLQHNNRCPLCRVDLMKEAKVVDEPVLPSLGHPSSDEESPSAPIPTEITQTAEEQMEEPHSSESDEEEEAQSGEESNEDRDGEAPQSTEEFSLNGEEDQEDGENGED